MNIFWFLAIVLPVAALGIAAIQYMERRDERMSPIGYVLLALSVVGQVLVNGSFDFFHGSGMLFAILVSISLLVIATGELRAELGSVNAQGYWTAENVVDHAYSALFCIVLLGAIAYFGFSYLSQTSQAQFEASGSATVKRLPDERIPDAAKSKSMSSASGAFGGAKPTM